MGIMKKWFYRSDGAAAIEFSLLVLPFMLLTLGTIEISLMLLSASIVESATDSASRLIRTGEFQQSSGDPELLFYNALCSYTGVLVDCNDMLVEAMIVDSYADYTSPTYDSDGVMIPQGFDVGGSGDKVIIRVAWGYKMLTPLVGAILNGSDGVTQFISTIVLQTEPYEFSG